MSEENEQRKDDGHDPNLVGPEDTTRMKMTGEGEPGSHSAVFGLTPDGAKHDDTKHTTTTSKPAHSKESAIGGGSIPRSEDESSNTTSNASRGAGVAEQMHDPKVAEPAHGGGTATETGAGDKPGSGVGGPAQGTGDVGSEGQQGGLMDKVKSYVGKE